MEGIEKITEEVAKIDRRFTEGLQMPSAKEKKAKDSSLRSAEERLMSEKISGLLYLCNPLANKVCKKDICFWYAWKNGHDNNSCFPCYKTCFEEYAARDAEGNPIVWPEGVASGEAIEAMKRYEQKNKRSHTADSPAEAAGRRDHS